MEGYAGYLVGGWAGEDVEECDAVGEDWVLGEAEGTEGTKPLGEREAFGRVWEKDGSFVPDTAGHDGDV